MSKYDVIVIGAGIGGLCNAGILAKNGKNVLILEQSDHIGGRAIEFPYKGCRIQLGWHQIEDTGSGLTKVFEYLGKELKHSEVSQDIPFWIDGKWKTMPEIVNADPKAFRRFIRMVTEELSWADIEMMADQPVRPWVMKNNLGEGVLRLLEIMAEYEVVTHDWWNHSLSEQLWMRKLHFTERRMAGYCYNPLPGWKGAWEILEDAVRGLGVEIRLNTPVKDILIEPGGNMQRVVGVESQTTPSCMATDYPYTEVIEAPCVISTLPCWDILKIVDKGLLPRWYVEQIKYICRDDLKVAWIGIYASLPEPLMVKTEREMPGWFSGPRTGLFGFATNFTAFAPYVSPPGEYLVTVGAGISDKHMKMPRRQFNKLMENFEKEAEDLFPVFKKRTWTQRHVVWDPAQGVTWKPGSVGPYRPDTDVPTVDGLYFASEAFRGHSVGCDRAPRIAMSVTEKILERPIPEFKDSWHYK